jgi:hypothetical protein
VPPVSTRAQTPPRPSSAWRAPVPIAVSIFRQGWHGASTPPQAAEAQRPADDRGEVEAGDLDLTARRAGGDREAELRRGGVEVVARDERDLAPAALVRAGVADDPQVGFDRRLAERLRRAVPPCDTVDGGDARHAQPRRVVPSRPCGSKRSLSARQTSFTISGV